MIAYHTCDDSFVREIGEMNQISGSKRFRRSTIDILCYAVVVVTQGQLEGKMLCRVADHCRCVARIERDLNSFNHIYCVFRDYHECMQMKRR